MNSLSFIRYRANNIHANNIVISFSLYGNINKYIGGLLENCKDINRIYPYFWIYVYIGADVNWSLYSNRFSNINNLKIIETGKIGHINMSYRFLSIDDRDVSVAFSRDADSRINIRDQYCINEFLKSDKLFNIIRDNQQHGVRILGGTWGIKRGLIKTKIEDLLKEHTKHKNMIFGDDQDFLLYYLYETIKYNVLIFDEFHLFKDENPEKIKVDYNELFGKRDYVGNRYMPINLNDPFGPHGEWYKI
jgi:hypothetical protein